LALAWLLGPVWPGAVALALGVNLALAGALALTRRTEAPARPEPPPALPAPLPRSRAGPRAHPPPRDALSPDALPVAALLTDGEGRVVSLNPLAAALLPGLRAGRSLADAFSVPAARVAELLARATRPGGQPVSEVLETATGSPARLRLVIGPRRDGPGHVIVIEDARELDRLETRFIESQKLHSIGQLAGGIAHDFNNVLAVIAANCELLLERRDEEDPDWAELDHIRQNVNRAADLVRQLLAFSRRQRLEARPVEVTELIADMSHLLERVLDERVTLELDCPRALAPVLADRRQLEQILLNLAVNARDAMPEGGRLSISARERKLARPLHRPGHVVPAGEYVEICVCDTGEGIAPENLERIFEPFFTTKSERKGTGLGLATVYGIVKQSGGHILVDSLPGQGSAFTVLLPAWRGDAATPGAAPDAPAPPAQAIADPAVDPELEPARILLVEDEVAVRAVLAKGLRQLGHEVTDVASGERALELLAQAERGFDVIVSDVVMPGLSGPEWVARARARGVRVPAVFLSGFAEEDHAGGAGNRDPGDAWLEKPVSLRHLSEVIARARSARQPSAADRRPQD
ncbi:MAG: response regulator, partial [Alphaproteobacteria bacterium]